MATGCSIFSAAFCRFFCGLWHGFCKIWKITGSPPEINFRADSGGRIPPKQIIYVRSGGNFFCCRTKNDKHSCHFSSKLLKSRPFCSPLKPEKIKNGWNHPPHTEKNCLFRWSPSPPCQVKEGRSGGQRMVKRTYIRKYFPDLSFLWLPENQAVQQGRSVRRMNWRHPLLQHILWPLPCTGLFPAVPRNL